MSRKKPRALVRVEMQKDPQNNMGNDSFFPKENLMIEMFRTAGQP